MVGRRGRRRGGRIRGARTGCCEESLVVHEKDERAPSVKRAPSEENHENEFTFEPRVQAALASVGSTAGLGSVRGASTEIVAPLASSIFSKSSSTVISSTER
ncbi:hypothetical protein L1987_57643 [Smallanthus sonchifolius]|uniref:Uncharacterized protein n=1 Tax=Smallanthus sonchifolius TaxID=185202 RepID=A0ACB9DDK1_9ASTR|nr:hypothetical protein L1987_57643 [Smallanthus sonchifolius]